MADARDYLLLIHLAGVFLFLIAHGGAGSVGFRLRRERDPARVAALLELSGSTLSIMGIAWLLVIASGIALGVLASTIPGAQLGWFYASIVLFIAVTFLMTPLASGYQKARAALKLKPPMVSEKGWQKQLAKGYTADKLGEYLSESKPMALAGVGFGGVLALSYLMMFKPF